MSSNHESHHTTDAPTPVAALPRTDVPTSTSSMAAVGIQLAAETYIYRGHNSNAYPTQYLSLDVANLASTYYQIIEPITHIVARNLGLRSTDATYDNSVMTYTQAYVKAALYATHAVIASKALRVAPLPNALYGQPRVSAIVFPQFVAALVNSIGPVTLDQPFRRTVIPTLSLGQIDVLYGQINHEEIKVSHFINACQSQRTILTATVDPLNNSSAAWWTFHSDPSYGNDEQMRVYSPVAYDAVPHHLKLAAAFSPGPMLLLPGVSVFSKTERFFAQVAPTHFNAIPAIYRQHPWFNVGYPAFYFKVEFETPTIDMQQDDTPVATGSKRKNRDSHKEGNCSVTYYYFDHIAIDKVNNSERSNLSIRLNSS